MNDRAVRRRAPRDQHRADRIVETAARHLERGYTPPRQTLGDRLAAILHRKGGQLAAPKRSRLRNGNPPGHYATARRLARTRQP